MQTFPKDRRKCQCGLFFVLAPLTLSWKRLDILCKVLILTPLFPRELHCSLGSRSSFSINASSFLIAPLLPCAYYSLVPSSIMKSPNPAYLYSLLSLWNLPSYPLPVPIVFCIDYWTSILASSFAFGPFYIQLHESQTPPLQQILQPLN